MVTFAKKSIRAPAVAGLFYPGNMAVLREQLDRFLSDGVETPGRLPRAMILPHAGYVYSGVVAASGYRELLPLRGGIRRVFLLGPAHRVYTDGVATASHSAFETPLGSIPLDRASIESLERRFDFVRSGDQSHANEHSLEVHLPFLQAVLENFELVPLVVGDISPQRLAELIRYLWQVPDSLVVVSSDLSHFHADAEARRIDAETVGMITSMQWQRLSAERACGFIPIAALLIVASELGCEIQALDVRNSSDTAGDPDRVVGYAAFGVYEIPTLGQADRDTLLGLARRAIEEQLDSGHAMGTNPQDFSPALQRQAACFVTLYKHDQLRGCIGSLQATEPLAANVCRNAAAAAVNDPRFPPLELQELPQVSLSVSVLSPATPMSFDSEAGLLQQLHPGYDGLIIQFHTHRATFLPAVWDQLPSPMQFLRALKRKAGLGEDFWSPKIRAWRYTSETFCSPPTHS